MAFIKLKAHSKTRIFINKFNRYDKMFGILNIFQKKKLFGGKKIIEILIFSIIIKFLNFFRNHQ